MIARALRGWFAAGAALAMASAAAAQPLGTFRWQLSPFCNVVSMAVTQNGSIYRLEGFDDRCGAAPRAIITGMAVPNADGTLEFGLTAVGAGGAPSHVDIAFHIPTLGGTWRDSAGNAGALVFNPGPVDGAPRPGGLGGAAIDGAQVQRRITGACAGGTFVQSVAETGAVDCGADTGAPGDITGVTAGPGLTGGGTAGTVPIGVVFDGPGGTTAAAHADHTHVAADRSVAIGEGAHAGNVGQINVAIGAGALALTTDLGQVAVGVRALARHTLGGFNTVVGAHGMEALTSGDKNTAIGVNALSHVAVGSESTAVGSVALFNLSSGDRNTAVGREALFGVGAGSANTALGHQALANNFSGSGNVAVGRGALLLARLNGNTAVGERALFNVTTGSDNIGIGREAGAGLVSGSGNIYIGAAAAAANETSTIRIGAAQTRAFIRGISGVPVGNAVPVLINILTGQLGTVVSSARFKEDIQPIEAEQSRRLQALRPVSFVYNPGYDSGARERHYGLIAEEAAATMPELVIRDPDGRPLAVRYHLLTPLLLAETQRQEREGAQMHRTYDAALQALRREIAALRAAMER